MTATEHCFQTLEHSRPEEKRFELDYIRRRLYQGPDYSSAPQAVLPETEPLPLSADQACAEARRILGDMENMTLKLTDGSRILLSADHHLVPTHHPNFERGLPGMSVFFDRAVKTAALGCEAQALRLLEDTKEDLLRSRRTYRQMSETFRAVLHPGLRKGVGGLLLSPCMDAAGIEDIIESLKLTSRSFDEENAGLYAGIGGLLLGCIAAAIALSRRACATSPILPSGAASPASLTPCWSMRTRWNLRLCMLILFFIAEAFPSHRYYRQPLPVAACCFVVGLP